MPRPQATQQGRSSSGASAFSEWRGRLGLSQLDASRLLEVTATTTQRWDAHPSKAPALLTPAMRYHEGMRQEVEWIKASFLDEKAAAELRAGVLHITDSATRENIKYLSPAGRTALEYGLAHGLV